PGHPLLLVRPGRVEGVSVDDRRQQLGGAAGVRLDVRVVVQVADVGRLTAVARPRTRTRTGVTAAGGTGAAGTGVVASGHTGLVGGARVVDHRRRGRRRPRSG